MKISNKKDYKDLVKELDDCLAIMDSLKSISNCKIDDDVKYSVIGSLSDFSEVGRYFNSFLEDSNIKLLCRFPEDEDKCITLIKVEDREFIESIWAVNMAKDILEEFRDEVINSISDAIENKIL